MLRKEDASKIEVKKRLWKDKTRFYKVYTFFCRHCGKEINVEGGDLNRHSGACKSCVAVDQRKTEKDYDDSILPEGAIKIKRQMRSSGGYRKIIIYPCRYPGCLKECRIRDGEQNKKSIMCLSHSKIKSPLEFLGSIRTEVKERSIKGTGRVIKFLYYVLPCTKCGKNRRVARSKTKEDNGLCRNCATRIRPYEALYNSLCCQKRNIEKGIQLTYEEFVEFTSIDSCEYCGNNVRWTKYSRKKNGNRYNLDRKNNDLGYFKDNLVVCCKTCNRVKREAFTYEETKCGMREVVNLRQGRTVFVDDTPVCYPLDLSEKPKLGKGCKKRLLPYEALYNQFDRAQKTTGREQSLSYEDFLQFTGIHSCQYCGKNINWVKYSPRAVGYNLDRKDNTKGYELGNIAVCCGVCNELKSSHLNYPEMKVFMREVIKVRNKEAPILGPLRFGGTSFLVEEKSDQSVSLVE